MGLLDIIFKHKCPCCDSRGPRKIEVVAEFPYDVHDDKSFPEQGDYSICHCKNCDRYFVSGEAAWCPLCGGAHYKNGVYVTKSGRFGAYCKTCNHVDRGMFITDEANAARYEKEPNYYGISPRFAEFRKLSVKWGSQYMIGEKWNAIGHYRMVNYGEVSILW